VGVDWCIFHAWTRKY